MSFTVKCQEIKDNSSEYLKEIDTESRKLLNGSAVKIEVEQLVHDDNASETKVRSPIIGVNVEEDIMLTMTGLSHQDKIDLKQLDEFNKSIGFFFGERFSLTEASWANTNMALTKLKLSNDLKAEISSYILHPCIIDACLQTKLCLELQKSISSGSPPPSIPVGNIFSLYWFAIF